MGSVPLINTYCRTFIRVFRQTLENDHGAYYKKKTIPLSLVSLLQQKAIFPLSIT